MLGLGQPLAGPLDVTPGRKRCFQIGQVVGVGGPGRPQALEAEGQGIILAHSGEGGGAPVAGQLGIDGSDPLGPPTVLGHEADPLLLARLQGGQASVGLVSLVAGRLQLVAGPAHPLLGPHPSFPGRATQAGQGAEAGQVGLGPVQMGGGRGVHRGRSIGVVAGPEQRHLQVRRGGAQHVEVTGPLGPQADVEDPRVLPGGEGDHRLPAQPGEHHFGGAAVIGHHPPVVERHQGSGVPGVGG